MSFQVNSCWLDPGLFEYARSHFYWKKKAKLCRIWTKTGLFQSVITALAWQIDNSLDPAASITSKEVLWGRSQAKFSIVREQ